MVILIIIQSMTTTIQTYNQWILLILVIKLWKANWPSGKVQLDPILLPLELVNVVTKEYDKHDIVTCARDDKLYLDCRNTLGWWYSAIPSNVLSRRKWIPLYIKSKRFYVLEEKQISFKNKFQVYNVIHIGSWLEMMSIIIWFILKELLNQYIVDMYDKLEMERFIFIFTSQIKLRVENFKNCHWEMMKALENLSHLVILPFIGIYNICTNGLKIFWELHQCHLRQIVIRAELSDTAADPKLYGIIQLIWTMWSTESPCIKIGQCTECLCNYKPKLSAQSRDVGFMCEKLNINYWP